MMFVPLQVGIKDRVQRLIEIAADTAKSKQHVGHPPAGVLARNALLVRCPLAPSRIRTLPGPRRVHHRDAEHIGPADRCVKRRSGIVITSHGIGTNGHRLPPHRLSAWMP
jgi:hypothetical protein